MNKQDFAQLLEMLQIGTTGVANDPRVYKKGAEQRKLINSK